MKCCGKFYGMQALSPIAIALDPTFSLLARAQAWRAQILWARRSGYDFAFRGVFRPAVDRQRICKRPCTHPWIYFLNEREIYGLFQDVWDMEFESCWTVERLKLWEMSIYYSTLTQAKHFDIFHRKYWLSSSELGASWLSSVQKCSRCNRPSPFAGV